MAHSPLGWTTPHVCSGQHAILPFILYLFFPFRENTIYHIWSRSQLKCVPCDINYDIMNKVVNV